MTQFSITNGDVSVSYDGPTSYETDELFRHVLFVVVGAGDDEYHEPDVEDENSSFDMQLALIELLSLAALADKSGLPERTELPESKVIVDEPDSSELKVGDRIKVAYGETDLNTKEVFGLTGVIIEKDNCPPDDWDIRVNFPGDFPYGYWITSNHVELVTD